MLYFGIGEASGLIVAITWAISCQAHTMISRISGSAAMIAARVPLYFLFMGILALIVAESYAVPLEALLFLLLSAGCGIAVGDLSFYRVCVLLGPRLALLLQSLSSAFAALLGYVFLGEHIGIMGMAGIAVATFGVAFVLMEGGVNSGSDLKSLPRSLLLTGIGLGFLTALALGTGFLFLKKALLTGIDPIWCAFVRQTIGSIFIWILALSRGELFSSLKRVWSDAYLVKLMLIGVAVSVIGNFASPLAFKYTETGIATMLIGLQPIFIIPLVAAFDKQIPSARALIGTLIAFAGSTMLFMR